MFETSSERLYGAMNILRTARMTSKPPAVADSLQKTVAGLVFRNQAEGLFPNVCVGKYQG